MNRIDFLRNKFVMSTGEMMVDKPIKKRGRPRKNPIILETREKKNKISPQKFEMLLNSDPSSNKQYLQWLIYLTLKDNLQEEDLHKASQYLNTLYKYKNKLSSENRDINRYKDVKQFFQMIEDFINQHEGLLESKNQTLKRIKEEGAEVWYEDEQYKIISILNFEGSKLYGLNTKWCTTQEHYYKSYTSRGDLYVVIDKTTKNSIIHKHQFHFEDNLLCDAKDSVVAMEEYFTQHPKVLEVFAAMNKPFSFLLKLKYGFPIEDVHRIIKGDFTFTSDIQINKFENFIIEGNLEIDGSNTNLKALKDIYVSGDLIIHEDCALEILEGKITVMGNIIAKNSNLVYLPKGLKVGKSLIINKSEKITHLPENSEIGGMVFASKCTALTHIPDNIKIKHNLYIKETSIKKIQKLPLVNGKIFV